MKLAFQINYTVASLYRPLYLTLCRARSQPSVVLKELEGRYLVPSVLHGKGFSGEATRYIYF